MTFRHIPAKFLVALQQFRTYLNRDNCQQKTPKRFTKQLSVGFMCCSISVILRLMRLKYFQYLLTESRLQSWRLANWLERCESASGFNQCPISIRRPSFNNRNSMKIFSLKILPAFPDFSCLFALETSLIELSILHSLYILFGWMDFHAAAMDGK